MKRTIIHSNKAPAAVGPYSQAVKVGNFLFSSGQIGIDPGTGKLQEGLDAQARQVLSNLAAVLAAAGTSMDNVVKSTIFLVDMSTFQTVNGIYAEAFNADPPARSTVAVAALPLGALVEIEVVALIE